MIQTIENLSRIALLELHMYFVYKALESEAIKIKKDGPDSSINAGDLDEIISVSKSHANAEMRDIQQICIFIDQRLLRLGVHKTSASTIHDEIKGNFLAFRGTGERHQLLSKFKAQADSDNEADVSAWLDETIEEESNHEKSLQRLALKLNINTAGIEPRFFSESEYKTFLDACFAALFCGGSSKKAVSIFCQLALSEAVSSNHAEHLYNLIRPASGIYWSYCKN